MTVKLSDEQIKVQADAQAKADKENKEKIKKEKRESDKLTKKDLRDNPVDFVRKDSRPGIYSTMAIGKRIQIRDRQHYYAKTQAEVDFFMNDPEVVVFNPGEPNKKKK